MTTKNGNDQVRFQGEIDRQFKQLAIEGVFRVLKRRTFKVHDKQIVGYSLLVNGLSSEASIILQENGLGGRQKMGCGFFEAWQGDQ